MNDLTEEGPWASFREVVESVVRRPLHEVQAAVGDQIAPVAELAKGLREEFRHHHEALADRVGLLDEALRQQTDEAAQRQVGRDEQLHRLVIEKTDALTQELRDVTEQSVAHRDAVERATLALSDRLRRQIRTLIVLSGACVVLLVAVLLAVVLTA